MSDESNAPAQKGPRIKKETRTLECLLTTDEIVEKARELAETIQEGRDIEDQKKASNNAFKKKADDNDAEQKRLGMIVTSGKESRDVQVVTQYDTPVAGLKREFREDTGEELKVCNMSQDECQMSLFQRDEDGEDGEEGEEPGDKRKAK